MNVTLHQSTIFDGLLFPKWFFFNDSVVGTLTRLQDGSQKFLFDSQYTTTFFSPQITHIGSGTHPVS